jgi:hypothetical protein
LSGAGFTGETPSPEGAPGPTFEVGGLLGRGGMGEVRVAHDRRLGRDVALKTAHPGDPRAAQRLTREAALTARLEHPNIVPVYAAGFDESGRPWYAMRRLPGRSLADSIATSPSGPEQLRLVRHVLEAAEGIAHAHARGVLHRDIKPSNIMVGPEGETVVADWGLACTLEEAAGASLAGTPGYMSPEQGRPGPIDTRADVYGLGAVLFTLLSGRAPPAVGPVPPLREVAPGVPPELAAIAHRALAPELADRYPSARAFADDLRAWFEGRRVAAYAYSTRELLRRATHTFRLPLSVGAVASVALALAVSWGWSRSVAEQGRARRSEGLAIAAQAEAESSLGAALAAQALSAARAGREMEAEILAANAIVHGPSPIARGILARQSLLPHFRLLRRGPRLEGCPNSDLSPDATVYFCLRPDGVEVRDLFAPDELRAFAAGDFDTAGFDGAGRIVLFDRERAAWRWEPPAEPERIALPFLAPRRIGDSAFPGRFVGFGTGRETLVEIQTGAVLVDHTCAKDQKGLSVFVRRSGSLVIGCSDGAIREGSVGAEPRLLGRIPPSEGAPMSLSEGPDGRLWVGTLRGEIRPLDGSAPALSLPEQSIRRLEISETRGAAMTDAGLVVVWNLADGAELGRIHGPPGPLRWQTADHTLRVVSDHAEDRLIPDVTAPASVRFPEGVGALAISPDGADVAVGLGDGWVHVLSRATGATVQSWRAQTGVVKDLAYSSDGQRLAVGTVTTDSQPVYDVRDGAVQAQLPGVKVRRLIGLPRAGWIVASYDPRLMQVRDRPGAAAEPLTLATESMTDLERDPTGARAAAIAAEDVVWRIEDGEVATATRLGARPEARAVAPVGAQTLIGTSVQIQLIGPNGQTTRTWPVTSPVNELAASVDGQTFASGHLSGDLHVWSLAEPEAIATLIGHSGRVNSLEFSPDGATLLSGSWDGTLRSWDMAVLRAAAGPLRDRVEVEWGRDLRSVLGAAW